MESSPSSSLAHPTNTSGQRGLYDTPWDTEMPLCNGVDIEEMTIPQLQKCFVDRTFTSRHLTDCYLERIRRLNSRLRAVIEMNPDALEIADQMDRERADGKLRGPLHGIPFLVKDNIPTADKMQTTAGSCTLEGTLVHQDAPVVAFLRARGAVLLGHSNLLEWAARRTESTPAVYSSRGGLGRNPYNLAFTPGGSSSGSAVSVTANMCAFSLGTDTDASITFPADLNAVIGIRPTHGLVSLKGVIPASRNLDTVGPFARTVQDAALILDAITDSKDAPYSSTISDKSALRGARFGIPWNRVWETGKKKDLALYQMAEEVFEHLKKAGAEIVTADFPSAEEILPAAGSMSSWDMRYGTMTGRPDRCEQHVCTIDFYNDIKTWLSPDNLARNPYNLRSLEDIVDWNLDHGDQGALPAVNPLFPTGQEGFGNCIALKGREDDTYRAALAYCRQKGAVEGIDVAMRGGSTDTEGGERLDALIVPITSATNVALGVVAKAGCPIIAIPIGLRKNNGIPFGVGLVSLRGDEAALLKWASAIEDLVQGRTKPTFLNPDSEKHLLPSETLLA